MSAANAIPATSPVRDEDLTFWISAYRDADLLGSCLASLRRHYPAARVVVRSDGDCDPRLAGLARLHGAAFRLEERLFPVENGGRLVHRMLEMYLEEPTPHLFKLDPDTEIHRRFEYLPRRSGHFGTLQGEPGARAIQGGCMGFTRDAAQALHDSRLLLSPRLSAPKNGSGHSHWTYLEFRARAFGLSSFDWSLGWAAGKLGIPLFDFPEVFCLSHTRRRELPPDAAARFAMTHPAPRATGRYRGVPLREVPAT